MIQITIRCSDGLQSLLRISKSEQFHQSKVGFQLSKNVKLSVKHSKQPSLVTIKNSHPKPKKFIQRNSKRKIFRNHPKNHPVLHIYRWNFEHSITTMQDS